MHSVILTRERTFGYFAANARFTSAMVTASADLPGKSRVTGRFFASGLFPTEETVTETIVTTLEAGQTRPSEVQRAPRLWGIPRGRHEAAGLKPDKGRRSLSHYACHCSAMPPASAASSSKALNAILPLIASGQPYEAHQKARTFASRYQKSGQFDTAIDVLFQSARELLKVGQQGSGTDLTLFLLDVYESKGEVVAEESRGSPSYHILRHRLLNHSPVSFFPFQVGLPS